MASIQNRSKIELLTSAMSEPGGGKVCAENFIMLCGILNDSLSGCATFRSAGACTAAAFLKVYKTC